MPMIDVMGRRTLVVNSSTTANTIGPTGAGKVMLHGVFVVAALTGTCTIAGFTDEAGAAQTITLPAATTAGWKDLGSVVTSAGSLVVTCSNGADDNLVLVVYTPLV